MQATRRGLLAATAIGSLAPHARAQGRPKIKIGVLNDQSGPYRDTTGLPSTGGAMVKAGGDSWFFITADYAFGHSLEQQTTLKVKAAGGTVKGAVRYPFPDTTDFSGFITQALSSRAKVIGLANAGLDTVNSV